MAVSTDAPRPTSATTVQGPLVVDLGAKKRKQIKQLRQGRGKLIEAVNDCLDELKATGAMPESAQPVIIIVREKRPKALWPMSMI